MRNQLLHKKLLIVPAIALSLTLFVLTATSRAHVFPHHSDPKTGATVSPAPEAVRIWFDGDLEPEFSKIVVKDAAGKQVDRGDCHVDASDPTLLVVSVPPLHEGKYKATWDVVGRDGHRTSGDYMFTVK